MLGAVAGAGGVDVGVGEGLEGLGWRGRGGKTGRQDEVMGDECEGCDDGGGLFYSDPVEGVEGGEGCVGEFWGGERGGLNINRTWPPSTPTLELERRTPSSSHALGYWGLAGWGLRLRRTSYNLV